LNRIVMAGSAAQAATAAEGSFFISSPLEVS
jgi:hypothetical protein